MTSTGRGVDDAMDALGLSYDMTTDPSINREILGEMKADDFQTSYPPMKDFLHRVISEPCDLGEMLAQIRWARSPTNLRLSSS